MCLNTDKAAQFLNFFAVFIHVRQFLNPRVIAFQCICHKAICSKVGIQSLPVDLTKFDLPEPFHMDLGPFGTLIFVPMAKAECIDLLLEGFDRLLMVVSHSQIIPDGLVILRRDMHGTEASLCQAFCYQKSISFVRLDAFAAGDFHCRRCKDHAFYIMSLKVVE